MIQQNEISISSVHNVFPFIADRDYDTDSGKRLAFDDLDKRAKAVGLSKTLLITQPNSGRKQ